MALTILSHAVGLGSDWRWRDGLRPTAGGARLRQVLCLAVPRCAGLLLLLFVWNALPQLIPAFRQTWFTPFLAALLALGLNETAYQAEISRAALLSVATGQRDAAAALGLSRPKAFFLIVLPQALRVALPPTVNEFITLLKTTSLASVISLQELLAITTRATSVSFRYTEFYAVALVYYLAIVSVLMIAQGRLERRLGTAGPCDCMTGSGRTANGDLPDREFRCPVLCAVLRGPPDRRLLPEGVEVEHLASPTPSYRRRARRRFGRRDVGGPLRAMRAHDRDPACDIVCFADAVARDLFFIIGRDRGRRLSSPIRCTAAGDGCGGADAVDLPADDLRRGCRSRGGRAGQRTRAWSERAGVARRAAGRGAALQPYAEALLSSGAGLIGTRRRRRTTAYTTFVTRRGH